NCVSVMPRIADESTSSPRTVAAVPICCTSGTYCLARTCGSNTTRAVICCGSDASASTIGGGFHGSSMVTPYIGTTCAEAAWTEANRQRDTSSDLIMQFTLSF